jgi:Iron-containing redox enzyme
MKNISELIDSLSPNYLEMDYYRHLFQDSFSKEQTMKAHLQDLARSLGCLGLREIQLNKLEKLVESEIVSYEDAEELREVICDELPSPNRKSHYEVRLQMFEGCGYSEPQLKRVIPVAEAQEATKIFRNIFHDRSLLEITVAVGAIEKWYVPLAAELEECYLKLGYTPYQVATYTLHKEADEEHSKACYKFINKYSFLLNEYSLIEAVNEGFKSVIMYDNARYKVATSDLLFDSYLS